jgi:hypothetical protein
MLFYLVLFLLCIYVMYVNAQLNEGYTHQLILLSCQITFNYFFFTPKSGVKVWKCTLIRSCVSDGLVPITLLLEAIAETLLIKKLVTYMPLLLGLYAIPKESLPRVF